MLDWIDVDLQHQALTLRRGQDALLRFAVSSAAAGWGERHGSGCTPRGWHRIRLKIGAGCAADAVFVARRATGERYSQALARAHPQRDWILGRILWLTGTEPGRNRGGAVDTLRRFIYIHGTPDTSSLGHPCSHGCIRMHPQHLLHLFDRVTTGMAVCVRPPGVPLTAPGVSDPGRHNPVASGS